MSLLKEESHSGLDITSSGTVLTYANDTGRNITVLVKVGLGDALEPIAGGGNYTLQAEIDDVPVIPDSNVVAEVGQTIVVIQSRHISLQPDQSLTVQVQGLPGDAAVTTRTVLIDVTPARVSDITGDGAVLIDHNYGGVDNLRVVNGDGAGVQSATVAAYLESDYDAGNYTAAFLKGRTTTNVDGRWRTPIALDADDYVLVVTKPGEYETEAVAITVA